MSKNKKIFFLGTILIIVIAVAVLFAIKANTKKPTGSAVSETAYSKIVKDGYKGTAEQLLASLVSEHYDSEKRAFDFAVENGYSKNAEEWLKNILGNKGKLLTTEKSSYDSVCENGFTGTEEQWLKTLEGINESDGITSYQKACENGFEGSPSDWLDCLSGTIKKDTHLYSYACKNGFKGTETQLLIRLTVAENIYSKDGKSISELADYNGFKGTEDELLDKIVGEKNADSKSRTLYVFATENGYKGSFTQWLCFLATPQYSGRSPYQVLQANGYEKSLSDFLNGIVEQNDNSKAYFESAASYGYRGTEEEWISVISGSFSASPYEVAVKKGYKGTEEAFYKEAIDKLNNKTHSSESIISTVYLDKNKHLIVELKDSTKLDLGVADKKKKQTKNAKANKDEANKQEKTDKVANYFTVTFTDFDDTVLAVKITPEGGSVTAPTEPKREGYLFKGWDKSFDNVKKDLTVKATYEKNDKPTIFVENVKAVSGSNDVAVAVSIRNNPGVLGMTLKCQYDDRAMTLKSVENGEAVANVLTLSKSKLLNNGCTFVWDGIEVKKDDIKDGDILIMHFKINDSVKNGKYPIVFSYEKDGIVDNNLKNVSVEMIDGCIEIVK